MVDPEGEARWLLTERGFDPACPPRTRELIRAHLGRGAIIRVPRLVAAGHPDRTYARVDGKHVIVLRTRMAREEFKFNALHELAEWHLRVNLDYRDGDIEEMANAIAACLIAPAEAYRDALRQHGERFPKLAERFVATQTNMALRLGESTGRPVAVITPRIVRVRGEDWTWGTEEQVRGLAKARRLPQGLQRVTLTDDRKRKAIVG